MVADRLPAMWGSETFTTVVSSTSMKVPNITATAMIQGLTSRPRGERDVKGGSLPSFREDGGDHGHARPKAVLLVLARLEDDLHRQPLHDLDVVPGRVLGGEEAEARASGGGDAVHVAAVLPPAVGVHQDHRGLARTHGPELALLEVGGDPNVVQGHGREHALNR